VTDITKIMLGKFESLFLKAVIACILVHRNTHIHDCGPAWLEL